MAIHLNPITTLRSDRQSAAGTIRHFVEAALRGHNPHKAYGLGDILFIYDEDTELFRFYSGRRNGILGEFDIRDWKHLYDRTATDIIIALLMRPCAFGQGGGNGGNLSNNNQSSIQQFFEPTADMAEIIPLFQNGTEGSSTPSESATMMNVFEQTETTSASELSRIMDGETPEPTSDQLAEMYGEVCDNAASALIAYLREPSTETGAMISF